MSSVVADKTGVGPSSAGEHALRDAHTGLGRQLAWLGRLRWRAGPPQEDRLSEETPLEQLLVRRDWMTTSRTHPERAKVLGCVLSELSEASRLLATRSDRDERVESELKALLLAHAPIRTVDDGWELAGRLKRLNLRLGGAERAYVQSLLENEYAHIHDSTHWHSWDQHFRSEELTSLREAYDTDPVDDAERARAVDRLNFLFLRRMEAGRDRRAKAALKDLYLRYLALVTVPFLLGLGAIACVSATTSHSVWRSFAVAALAGALGSTLSSVLKLRDQLLERDELRAFKPAMLVQPLVGASAGALVFLLLAGGAVSVGSLDPAAWTSPGLLGFVAGFSEPFLLCLVDRVAGLPEQRPAQPATAPSAQPDPAST
jgi:hypothetical protein